MSDTGFTDGSDQTGQTAAIQTIRSKVVDVRPGMPGPDKI
jgi:hypothetical protein